MDQTPNTLQDVIPPPCPSKYVSREALYKSLVSLRQWVLDQQDLFEASGRVPDNVRVLRPRALQDDSVHASQGVFMHYEHLLALRFFRSQFDIISREYELDWDSTKALRLRLALLQMISLYLHARAFEGREQREAREETERLRLLGAPALGALGNDVQSPLQFGANPLTFDLP